MSRWQSIHYACNANSYNLFRSKRWILDFPFFHIWLSVANELVYFAGLRHWISSILCIDLCIDNCLQLGLYWNNFRGQIIFPIEVLKWTQIYKPDQRSKQYSITRDLSNVDKNNWKHARIRYICSCISGSITHTTWAHLNSFICVI